MVLSVHERPAHFLGREGEPLLPLIKVKAPPEKMKSLCSMHDVLSVYHMNKEHWVGLLLDEADPDPGCTGGKASSDPMDVTGAGREQRFGSDDGKHQCIVYGCAAYG